MNEFLSLLFGLLVIPGILLIYGFHYAMLWWKLMEDADEGRELNITKMKLMVPTLPFVFLKKVIKAFIKLPWR